MVQSAAGPCLILLFFSIFDLFNSQRLNDPHATLGFVNVFNFEMNLMNSAAMKLMLAGC